MGESPSRMDHERLLLRPGQPVRLADLNSRATPGYARKSDVRDKLPADIERLVALQDVFAAARSHALLIVLQGMDTSGKDGAIKHVMSGVNPQGVDVLNFKTPTPEEEAHDFLWRCAKVLPERGRIGIFNRSYYEEVAIVRVHREMLAREAVVGDRHTWSDRFEDINAFERHLVRAGTLVVKFFLHVSKDEQRKRLLERLDVKSKNWKFSANDALERKYWDRYIAAYESALTATTTDWAPWYVIPADHKWFVRTAIADILVAKLTGLGLSYPRIEGEAATALAGFRHQLEAEPKATSDS
jgi:PPK2 family polyphosphate:nucleotide phosphotransferase